jgi:hypothetical protein
VVLARDNRTGAQRQRGEPSNTALGEIPTGRAVLISGTIQPVPRDEQMSSWGLTTDDRKELMERRVYVHADSVAVQDLASESSLANQTGTPAP